MWIELHDTARDHPKILKLARDLGIGQAQALGHVCALWTWVLRMAPDGDLESFDTDDIELGALWEGDRGALVESATRHRLLEQTAHGLAVHKWSEYATHLKSAERKRKQRERMRAQRSRDTRAQKTPVRTGHKDRPDQTDQTDQTGTDQTDQKALSRSRPRDMSVRIQIVWGHYRQRHPQCRALLKSGDKRYQLIRQRLADGFTTDALRKSIDGYHGSPFHLGENDRGKRYLGLGLIMRDADKTQAGIEMADNPDLGKDRRPQKKTWIDAHNELLEEMEAASGPQANTPNGALGDPEVIVPTLSA